MHHGHSDKVSTTTAVLEMSFGVQWATETAVVEAVPVGAVVLGFEDQVEPFDVAVFESRRRVLRHDVRHGAL